MTKRLDAIRQRINECDKSFERTPLAEDLAYLLSLVEKRDKVLQEIIDKDPLEINGHFWDGGTDDEIAFGIHRYFAKVAQQALKCDEGGEVGE